ncbi:MAG: YggS family pyridoxal phosphate-dependent enzyme [Zoogloeaceae bacterium]|jgi:pyridoxal phosphate enzyme (YggS family)|nr:YggS family pyridoxal phosphate-dependent enzyme [Zoogloeaceae bacterium]
MSVILANLQAVRQRIHSASAVCGQNAENILLLAVSKTRPLEDIFIAASGGQRDFGESYAQEGVEKIRAARALRPDLPLVWHFIGPIQSNKTRLIAEYFDWAHSIDRLKIAERLSLQRPGSLPPLQALIEINVSGEASKSGALPEEALTLARAVSRLSGLTLRGLMCVPAPTKNSKAQRQPFAKLAALFQETRQTLLRENPASATTFDTLSMGMSDDFTAAIHEGSTLLRIGSALFGARPPRAAAL